MINAQVAVLQKPRELVFKDEPLDTERLGPEQLICETLWTAISPGTEIGAYVGAPALRPGVTYPRVVGYCNVAQVLHRGSGVRHVHVRDRVLTFTSHRSHFSIQAGDVLAVIPDAVRSEDAAGAYLFHLGYSALLSAGVRLGSTVVVVGLGVMGLGSVAMATLAGARVFGISDQALCRERARAMGATDCYERSRVTDLIKRLGERRAQVVITTSNDWNDWTATLQCAGNRATIAVLGFPGRHQSTVPMNPLDSAHFYARQLRIISVGMSPELPDSRGFLPFNERENLQRILGWIAEGRLRTELLVSAVFEGNELADAYERLSRPDRTALTYLLRWAR